METTVVNEVQTNLNVVWTLIAGILVFTMQAGFALVETGFTRAKNAANIMMKNLMDFAAGSLGFYLIGAALMFGASKAAGWLGWGGLGMPSLATGGAFGIGRSSSSKRCSPQLPQPSFPERLPSASNSRAT